MVTYADLKRIIQALRETAKEMYGKEIWVGDTIDAGPEFVESEFKFERHPELLKGGPKSEFPKSLAFLCCYAEMNGDKFPYATFRKGIPQGTPFGTFLGRQFESLASTVGFDYVWFSNGFGLTHYAWNYLGEIFDGRESHPERAPENIKKFVSFWENFRAECPKRPIEIRGTNFSIGMDAATHGIDIREIYRVGGLHNPSPNPPWGSSNLGLEMVSHLSRISSTPQRSFPFRYYINDSWFAVVPWADYYNREAFDVYCPMSASRINASGKVETPTDMDLMTVNTGFGELITTQASEVEPHLRRAFDIAPDEAGPLVWIYPFTEYSDELHRPSAQTQKAFFGDWFVARSITGGLPLNTVTTTDNFTKLSKKSDTFGGRVIIAPAPAAHWNYADSILEHVKKGGEAIIYGSLHDAPKNLLDALNIAIDDPIEGDLDITLQMKEDTYTAKPPKRPLRHPALQNDGGVTEVLADKSDKATQVRATVSSKGKRRVYAVVREARNWKGGKLAWIRGTLPFEAKADSLEPVMFKADEVADASPWMRYLLSDFNIDIRNIRRSISNKPNYLFAARSRGSYFFNGHSPDTTVDIQLRFPEGAPIFCERQTFVANSTATYHLDRTSNFECQAFLQQTAESLVSHKEGSTTPETSRNFTLHGLIDGTLTLYIPEEARNAKRLKVKKILPYTIQDPTAALPKPKNKADQERDLKWKVDPITGGIVVEKVSGSVSIAY
jgi:hypothetical protein